MSSDWNLGAGAIGYSERGSAKQGRSQEFDLGVYVLTIHSNFKTYVNVPHVNIYHIESVLSHRRERERTLFATEI